jgi:hypothetical protein
MARRIALVVSLLGTLAVLGLLVLPFAAKERTIAAAVPQPPPLASTALIALPAHEQLCTRSAAMDAFSERMLLQIGTNGRRAVPLDVTITGERAYRYTGQIQPTYADNAVVVTDVDPPPGPRAVRICLRNEGEHQIDLYAADEAGRRTRLVTTVDRVAVRPNPVLTFSEAKPTTFVDRAGTIADRVATFRPGGSLLVTIIALLVLVAVPVALGAALVVSAGKDDKA